MNEFYNQVKLKADYTNSSTDGNFSDLSILTLSQASPDFHMYASQDFENTAGKGEIALNEQFLLFPQCFLPIWKTFCHFHKILNCHMQTLSVWTTLKFIVWERVNTFTKKKFWTGPNCQHYRAKIMKSVFDWVEKWEKKKMFVTNTVCLLFTQCFQNVSFVKLLNGLMEKTKMFITSIIFPFPMFSTHPKKNICFSFSFILLSANDQNLNKF